MSSVPVTVHPHLSIEAFSKDYVVRYQQSFFPVVRDNELLGYVAGKDARKVVPLAWGEYRVSEIMHATGSRAVPLDADMLHVLDLIKEEGLGMVMVEEGGRLYRHAAFYTLEEYRAAKLRLRTLVKPGGAVVLNADDAAWDDVEAASRAGIAAAGTAILVRPAPWRAAPRCGSARRWRMFTDWNGRC